MTTVLALTFDHPAYDCVTLGLAEATAPPFVIADARLLGRIAEDRSGHFSGQALALAEASALVASERG